MPSFRLLTLSSHQSAVTCLLWPEENTVVFGLVDGKVEREEGGGPMPASGGGRGLAAERAGAV